MKQNKGFKKGALFGALTVLLIVGVLSCGMKLTGGSEGKDQSKSQEVIGKSEETKITLLKTLIDHYYRGDVDEEALQEGLYKGYIEALGDPYSAYYDEEETKELNEAITGEFCGIGALMSQDKSTGLITIVQVYENSPASEAGLKEKDILYKVDGKDIFDKSLNEVVNKVRGEEGSRVELTVLRGEDGEEVTMTATRRVIQSHTVESQVLEGDIGVLSVSEFGTVTKDQYKNALEELENQGIQGLIVDLRGNPGGSLDVVVDILDEMLPEGMIVSVKDKDGKVEEYTSDDEHQFRKPLVVLVDGNSASASEIYAGAIQDYGIGQIVGTQTYGKGVVQQIYDLKDGSCVKLTIAEYLTPKGRSIDGEGITPDVEVEYERDENRPDYDNQMEKALELIKSQL